MNDRNDGSSDYLLSILCVRLHTVTHLIIIPTAIDQCCYLHLTYEKKSRFIERKSIVTSIGNSITTIQTHICLAWKHYL